MSKKKKLLLRRMGMAIKFAVGFIIVSPVVYALMVSFMSSSDISGYPPTIIPESLDIENYLEVLGRFPLMSFLKNSLIVCAVVITVQIITSSLAAYAFAFFEFPGKGLLFDIALLTMMIPAETIILSNYRTMCDLKLVDTYYALVLPYLASGMGIFLLRQFFLTIPKELKQAAYIDGCSDWRFLLSIVMPISKPIIASLGVYVFVLTYNQYMWPLFVTNRTQMRTIQVGMGILLDAEAVNYGNATAGAVVTLFPVVLIFIIGQKYLIKGMLGGAVKG